MIAEDASSGLNGKNSVGPLTHSSGSIGPACTADSAGMNTVPRRMTTSANQRNVSSAIGPWPAVYRSAQANESNNTMSANPLEPLNRN